MGDPLIKVLERNSSMLNAQLEAQNINCQLDNLIAAMNELIDILFND